MDFQLLSPLSIIAFLLFLYFILQTITRNINKNAKNGKSAPQAAGAWPIIGHLHLLGSSELPHKTLSSMADKLGPIFTLKLGSHPAVVVNSWEIAKECLTTKDSIFANRPKSIAVEIMGNNYAAFGLAPYGPYWREMRKIATLELLSNRRLDILGHIRRSEVRKSISEIHNLWAKSKQNGVVMVDMTKWFADLNLNIMVKTIAGKRYSDDENQDQEEVIRFQKSIRDFSKYLGMFVVADAIPYWRWLDFGGHEKGMKKTGRDIDSIFQKWLDEHKQHKDSGEEVKEQRDFMDVLLSILDGSTAVENHSNYDSDTIVKGTCLSVLAGGTDTITVTLTWALSLLLNHPRTLKKAREELALHIGKERQVEESDTQKLAYLHAIIKETFRFYPALPLLIQHQSVEDCTIGEEGYHVQKGTRLIVNAWKIHRDPRIWPDPNEFKPERFMTTHKDVEFRGHHFELIPFGSGRRICPGISLSEHVIPLALATLLHGFEIEPAGNKSVDMTEGIGLTNMKATPLEVFLSPRLSSSLYD